MNIQDMIRKNIREILEEEEARKKNAGIDRDEPDPDEDDFTRKDAEPERRKIGYMIKVLPKLFMPEDMKPDEIERSGMECDGYFLLTFKDGKVLGEIIRNVSMDDLQKAFLDGKYAARIAMAAAVIADAEIRMKGMVSAAELAQKMIDKFGRMIKEHEDDEEDDEDEEDD